MRSTDVVLVKHHINTGFFLVLISLVRDLSFYFIS